MKSVLFRSLVFIRNRNIYDARLFVGNGKIRRSNVTFLNCRSCGNDTSNLKDFVGHPGLARYLQTIIGDYANHINHNNKEKVVESNLSFRQLKLINDLVNELKTAHNDIKMLSELKADKTSDDEFKKSLDEELKINENKIMVIKERILEELVPEDNTDSSDIMMEVNAGVGGSEAMLFTKELFSMYCNYTRFKNWTLQMAEFNDTELGGIRSSTIMISGHDALKYLQFEAGVHRVQRVPKTEKYGRMHTSTASVAVLLQPSEIEIDIKDSDIKVDVKTSSAPGGQHVNKIQTAVRIHHLPTGLIVECQVHRSQYQNRKLAMQNLRTRLYNIEQRKQDSNIKTTKKRQVGTSSRNEKIRTYNFNQDRMTDHRFKKTVHNISEIFQGKEHFDKFIEQLLSDAKEQKRKQFLESLS